MPRHKKEIKAKKETRGRKPHIQLEDMDHLYQLINHIQVEKEITYIRFTNSELVPMLENILNDASLKFSKKHKRDTFLYRVKPTFSTPSIEDVENDLLEDEIIEHGQLF